MIQGSDVVPRLAHMGEKLHESDRLVIAGQPVLEALAPLAQGAGDLAVLLNIPAAELETLTGDQIRDLGEFAEAL
ncbi:hypothetical protein GCM10011609_30350 [Lentzea pudingi]|uniref:Uncharacterized protein n=1 Tax=Lentzea pudingi TaxID=1789439 RepID=A0ABQ2HTF3_9PSEU|nr:hypothetical protein [Lentzea pudingi]GGM91074.1 hypothetical protein GCM10011609_30350 [Lentzea pudingi]